jgi:predicted glycosyltransferase
MSATASDVRIALYSHDTVGLGHTRRQLAIAEALSNHFRGAQLLLITGNPEAGRLPAPERLDLVTVPTVTKAADGRYVPRRLGLDLDEVIGLRRAIVTAALETFAPDLLIVDKVPQGLGGELLPALERLRGRTTVVLGLREVLDDPESTRASWLADGVEQVIRDHYDEVWVYGDRDVFDPATEYGWGPEVTAKTAYLGYLGRGTAMPDDGGPATDSVGGPVPIRPAEAPEGDYVLCQTGGGADGEALARAFLEADLPSGCTGVVLTGPYLPVRQRNRLHALAERTGRHRVLGFTDEAEAWLGSAAAVVSMGGYNSTVEILSGATPALIVPRVHPRREQLIRAASLQATGALDLLSPEQVTPAGLGAWIAEALAPDETRPPHLRERMLHARSRLNLSGLTALLNRTDTLIGASDHAA